jgi:hypothetical protein
MQRIRMQEEGGKRKEERGNLPIQFIIQSNWKIGLVGARRAVPEILL